MADQRLQFVANLFAVFGTQVDLVAVPVEAELDGLHSLDLIVMQIAGDDHLHHLSH